MRKALPVFVFALAAGMAALAGCGGKAPYDFTVTSVVNYSNPATAPIPGGQAIINFDAGDLEYPTSAPSYTAYFRDMVDGPYVKGMGGTPTLGTMFTDNGDGTFEIVVTIPVSACGGPMVVVADDYEAPAYSVPLTMCP